VRESVSSRAQQKSRVRQDLGKTASQSPMERAMQATQDQSQEIMGILDLQSSDESTLEDDKSQKDLDKFYFLLGRLETRLEGIESAVGKLNGSSIPPNRSSRNSTTQNLYNISSDGTDSSTTQSRLSSGDTDASAARYRRYLYSDGADWTSDESESIDDYERRLDREIRERRARVERRLRRTAGQSDSMQFSGHRGSRADPAPPPERRLLPDRYNNPTIADILDSSNSRSDDSSLRELRQIQSRVGELQSETAGLDRRCRELKTRQLLQDRPREWI
jgi:hypothetical protein